MAKKQLPVVGGVRKSINVPATTTNTSTTIAGLEGQTITIAQLAQYLANLQPNSGLVGDGTEASLVLGPGLAGGGPLLGPVSLRLTAPIPAFMMGDDGLDGEPGLVIPGPRGLIGLAGQPIPIAGDDGEDGLTIPGPAGAAGVRGTDGVVIPIQPDDPDDPMVIPGQPGMQGPPGATGPVGAGITVQSFSDDPEDPQLYPGVAGPPGATGSRGLTGITIPFYPDDPDDPSPPIPGSPGLAGAPGIAGANGVTVFLYSDDPDDALVIPGQQGPAGVQGPAGLSGSSAGGWAAQFQEDNFEDPLSALRNVPGDLFVRSLSVGSPPTAFPLYVYAASGGAAAFSSQGGLTISGPAATQDNFLTWEQVSQYIWQLYTPANVNDMHWYNNTLGDHTVWFGNGGAQMNLNSSSYGSTAGTVAGLILENSSTTMQSAIEFQKAGVVMGRIRSDYVGNMSYVVTGSGVHDFFIGGDSGVGGISVTITPTYGFQTNAWRNIAATGMIDWSPTTYGTMRITGAIAGGYTGIMANDGTFGPTLMANSGTAGIYNQTLSKWLIYDSAVSASISNITVGLTSASSAIYLCGQLYLPNITVSATATAGGGATLPASVYGYMTVTVDGTPVKIAYYKP